MAKKTNIPIFGITRNTDDGVCKDGECLELINARIKNGSLEPIGRPIQEKVFASERFSKIFFHSIAKKYIGILSVTGQMYSMNEDYSGVEPLSDSVLNVDMVEFIGYTMMAINDECIHYFIFSNGTYRYLGTKPAMPIIKFSSTSKVISEVSTEGLFGRYSAPSLEFDEHKVIDYNAQTGYFTKCLDQLDFTGKALCRYALKMYDGSYIMHSPVYIIQASEMDYTVDFGGGYGVGSYIETLKPGKYSFITSKGKKDVSDGGYYTGDQIREFAVLGFTPIAEIISSNLSGWGDIITGVDLFITDDIDEYTIQKLKTNSYKLDYEMYVLNNPDQDSLINRIKKTSLFYRFAQISVDKDGNLGEIEKIKDFKSLVFNETLPDDQFTHNTYSPKCSFVYNSKLHIGNIKTNIFKGFPIKAFSAGSVNSYDESCISVYLTTVSGGLSIVKISEQNVYLTSINPYLMYPDNRANKMIIELRKGTLHYQKEYNLKSSSYMNMSYWINDVESEIQLLPDDVSTWVSDRTLAIGETLDKTETNTVELSSNKLKVSELNNPFFFPAKTTYQPSNGKIIALCSNTSALSQGQFGQHPLLVFCDDGIFAMSVGTDGVTYATSTPVTRDVCNNAKSVKGIDNAVVFSTEQGVMMIQGSQVVNLSTEIDGYLSSCIDSSPVIGKIMAIPNLGNALSVVTFLDYAKEAEIGYNYQEREIIVANPSYSYVYVYNFNSSSWCKMATQIDSFVNSYPDILALSHRTVDANTFSVVWNMQNNHRSVADIVFISRPVKLGTLTHKRILQSAMRGMVKKSNSDLYLRGEAVQFRSEGTDIFSSAGFYVLGSNDAEHFTLIAGREKIVDVRDLITKMNKTKAFKYFMFAVVGGVRTDVAINYIELIVDESFENRLR